MEIYLPTGQFGHDDFLSYWLYLPVGHDIHSVEPREEVYLPVSHDLQLELSGPLLVAEVLVGRVPYVPVAQVEHELLKF